MAAAGAAVIVKVVAAVTVSGVPDVAEPPLSITVKGPVAAPAGITNVSLVAVVDEAGAVRIPPLWLASVTSAAVPELGCRFVPLTVIGVPMAPEWGVKLVMVGGGRLVTVRLVEPVTEPGPAAVIVELPAVRAVARPWEPDALLMVATVVTLELHMTVVVRSCVLASV